MWFFWLLFAKTYCVFSRSCVGAAARKTRGKICDAVLPTNWVPLVWWTNTVFVAGREHWVFIIRDLIYAEKKKKKNVWLQHNKKKNLIFISLIFSHQPYEQLLKIKVSFAYMNVKKTKHIYIYFFFKANTQDNFVFDKQTFAFLHQEKSKRSFLINKCKFCQLLKILVSSSILEKKILTSLTATIVISFLFFYWFYCLTVFIVLVK